MSTKYCTHSTGSTGTHAESRKAELEETRWFKVGTARRLGIAWLDFQDREVPAILVLVGVCELCQVFLVFQALDPRTRTLGAPWREVGEWRV